MKIAHVTATFPPYQAGTGNVCYYNAIELARLGHDVHVFTASISGAPAYEQTSGITIHRLRPLLQIGNAPLLPQLLWQLQKFEVVHLHFPFIFGAEIASLATRISRTPLVISFHNDLIGDGRRARIFTLYQRLSASLTVRHATRLCVVSLDHYRNSHLCQMLGKHEPLVVDLPNGVDTNHFHPDGPSNVREHYGTPSDARLVLFVASLDRAHHFKGLERLLVAIKDLPEDVWLIIVGDGDLRQHYEQMAQHLNVAGRTVFVGNIPHEETPPFYRAADVTVLPSSPPESFGLVLVESMSCGTPVIASNIPGVRTVVSSGKNGLLASDTESSDLHQKLDHLLSMSPAERHTMGKAGRGKVEQSYDWKRIGIRLEKLYQDVLGLPHHQSTPAIKALS